MDFNDYVCDMKNENVKVIFSYSNETLKNNTIDKLDDVLECTLKLDHGKEPELEVVFKDFYSLKEFLNQAED